ncbi:sensor histidine kinase [Pseudomarimonas arenosa]|uniref:histidine kinase n=1 Tax=Pseudomarimonas arenosa TaxID=2774145 RepID=A0AAW3ZJJ0_9GAMM|nr:ATP-binding protein [Pseudomarimonas arenosa]MBD8525679.1 hypothetical protein [Pseudomarimonas arenosa]
MGLKQPPQVSRIRPWRDGLVAFATVALVAALGVFATYHAAWQAKFDAIRTQLEQLARAAAPLIDGDGHRQFVSADQMGSPEHLAAIKDLVAFHRAVRDIYYVYTAIERDGRVYFVLGTDYLYRVDGDALEYDPIMTEYRGPDPSIRMALREQRVVVQKEPVQERHRTYLSAYAPIFDSAGEFVAVVGLDMWISDLDEQMWAVERAAWMGGAVSLGLALLIGLTVFQLRRSQRDSLQQLESHEQMLMHALAEAEHQAVYAQAASKAKTDFLATISHEIRTPMTVVLGMAGLLHATPLDATQAKYLDKLECHGRRLIILLEEMIDIVHIESGTLRLDREPSDWREPAIGLCDEFQPIAEEKGIGLERSLPSDLPEFIRTDARRLEQVLKHMLDNAVKFTERGKVCLSASRSEDGMLRLCVRDTGIGLSRDQQAKLFTWFSQVDNSATRAYDGTGIGLTLSKRLVELLGGRFSLESEVGKGTCVCIDLPLESGASTATAESSGLSEHA